EAIDSQRTAASERHDATPDRRKPQLRPRDEIVTQNATGHPLPSRPGQPPVLLYCRPCFSVRLMSPTDAAPRYREGGDDIEAEPDQGRDLFLQTHSGHALSALKKKREKFFADRPVWDPFRVAYEEVTDGPAT